MALQLSVPSSIVVSGSIVNATYWHAVQVNVDFIGGKISIMMGGYADSASYAADPGSYLMAAPILCPSAANPSFVLSNAYLTANYGSSGPTAYMAALQTMVANDPFFSGSTIVS